MDLTRHRCFLVSGMAIAATILLSWTISAAANEKTNTKEGSLQKAEVKKPGKVQPAGKPMTMSIFLDRLMMAESGGNHFARNRRSTATGSFQFIVSRTDRKFARKAAEAYTKDNAAHLAAAGHKPTFTNLRLAFLLGPGGANRILSAPPKAKVGVLLGRAVMRANPFMSGMTASDLVARAARDIATDPRSTAGIKAGKLAKRGRRPRIRVRCNLARPSCKRWLALKRRRLARTASKANRANRKARN